MNQASGGENFWFIHKTSPGHKQGLKVTYRRGAVPNVPQLAGL